MYAPINKIKWIKIVDYRKSRILDFLFPVYGLVVGTAAGLAIGGITCIITDGGAPKIAAGGVKVGAIIGTSLGVAALIQKGGNYAKKGKIHLTGKKAWEIKPVDANEIINSYINSAIPID